MPSKRKSKTVSKKVAQKGGSKKTVAKKVAQKAGAKKTVTKKTVAAPAQATPAQAAPAKATPAQAAPAQATPAKTSTAKTATAKTAQAAPAQTATKTKNVRSFKVQLPGTEEYTGRFTGSTPYQAANKALSKYFRSVENPKPVVTFSIRESTRGSKHNIYTYEGHRIKLDTPVSYTIGGGNTIVKHHKNQLKKIKKADLPQQENL